MKTKFLTLTSFLLMIPITVLFINSCKKYISPNPLSTFSPEITFGSVTLARTAVMGAYNSLTGDYGYGIRISMYYPYDSDEMMGAGGNTQDNDRRDISRYNLTSNNAQLQPIMAQSYQGIERSNLCIYYIPRMSQYTSGTTMEQGELKRLYGESLTLRAQYYFELIRNWGDVPAQWTPSQFQTNLFLPKTDRDTIYNHILNDLLIAENLVPWRTDVGTVGDPVDQRITKGTVKALRARIALFRGGYSLRAKSGVMERGSDYLTYYKIAFSECSDLLARRDEHTLDPSYKAVWQTYICGHNGNDPSGEIMFQVAMGGATSTSDSKLGTYNGTKFGTVGGGSLAIMPTYFYMYDSTDVRRDVTCVPFETNTDYVTRKGHSINAIVDGKWRKEWLTNPAFPANPTSPSNLGLNWVIQRFSDVLLMYAEADNEINGAPSAADIAAVKEVSTRAHSGNASLVPPIPNDYTGFFKYIVRERMLEFGSEAVRKYDLIRWNLLTAAINETKANLANMGAATPMAMNPPSYMAPPPAYCISANLPKTMYYNADFKGDDSYWSPANGAGAGKGLWANSLYQPAPAKAPVDLTIPGNTTTLTTKVSWLGYSGINTSFTTIFAYAFKTNHSELLPYYSQTLINNPAFGGNNYGY